MAEIRHEGGAMKITFNDGVEFDTSGPYRIESRADGLYAVGHGMLVPVKTREEGEKFIHDVTEIGG
jgi:hypothetical protein